MASYLEIVDTAVKIGLGAIISGAAAFFLARGNHGAERIKLLLERKLGNMEQAAREFNEYTNAFSQLLSAIDGVRIAQKNDDPLNLHCKQTNLSTILFLQKI